MFCVRVASEAFSSYGPQALTLNPALRLLDPCSQIPDPSPQKTYFVKEVCEDVRITNPTRIDFSVLRQGLGMYLSLLYSHLAALVLNPPAAIPELIRPIP